MKKRKAQQEQSDRAILVSRKLDEEFLRLMKAHPLTLEWATVAILRLLQVPMIVAIKQGKDPVEMFTPILKGVVEEARLAVKAGREEMQ